MHDKIIQLDGNDTCSESNFSYISSDNSSSSFWSSNPPSDCSILTDDDEFQIPVIVNIFKNQVQCSPTPSWYDPPQKPYKHRKPVRVTLRRDNRLEKSCTLPIIAVSNCRSLMPKLCR